MSAALQTARERWRETADAGTLIAQIPYAAWLGMEARALAPADGKASTTIEFRLPFRDLLVGNARLPALHGGAIAAFMENAATLHLLLTMDQPRVPRSIDFSLDYLRSGRCADLYAHCEVERLGRRVAQVQIRALQEVPDGSGERRCIALARTHFLLEAPE